MINSKILKNTKKKKKKKKKKNIPKKKNCVFGLKSTWHQHQVLLLISRSQHKHQNIRSRSAVLVNCTLLATAAPEISRADVNIK